VARGRGGSRKSDQGTSESIRNMVMAVSADDPRTRVRRTVHWCAEASRAPEFRVSWVCTINPQVGKSIQIATNRMVAGNPGVFTSTMTRMKTYVERHGGWVRSFGRPPAYSCRRLLIVGPKGSGREWHRNAVTSVRTTSTRSTNPYCAITRQTSLAEHRSVSN